MGAGLASVASVPTIYKAVVHPELEGGYWAEVTGLPGCFTQGKTHDEVYLNLTEAIACHLALELDEVRVDLKDG